MSDLRDPIIVTAADIEAEHRAALATLTPDQRRALDRLANARQRTNFNGRFPQENLQAIFAAEASVGLVSPRSTCESIGALTPERSARSRRERPIASRRALIRGPTEADGSVVVVVVVATASTVALMKAYAITDACMSHDNPAVPRVPSPPLRIGSAPLPHRNHTCK